MTTHHDLKLIEDFEPAKRDGRKLWEYRSTEDRAFAVGDTVTFHYVTRESREMTGRTYGPVTITYCHQVSDQRCVFSHTPEGEKTPASQSMVQKKRWEEFRATGLLWWINALLHTFGWALVVEVEGDGTISTAYPARVKFRGFGPSETEEGYRKVSAYLAQNASEINEEAQA